MKIGIITYHKGLNHGGFLQCFCLQQYLINLGYDVKVLNYTNPVQEKLEKKYFFFFKPWFSLWSLKVRFLNIFKFLSIRKSIKNKLHTTHIIDNNSIEKESKAFDVIILGSDEIWNVLNPLFPKEKSVFMGEGLKAKRIISYAPSFGQCQFSDLNKNHKVLLTNLSAISVRDYNSQKIIEKIFNQSAPILPDPTFLVNSYKYFKTKKKTNSKYILVYLNSIEKSDIDIIYKFAKENKLKIISLSYYHYWADKNIISAGIDTWLCYMKYAEFVVTNTFHGLIYAFQNCKPTYIVNPQSKRNKIEGLAQQFGFSEILNKETKNSSELSNYFKLTHELFKKNQYLIQEKRDLAQNYLSQNVNDIY